MKKIGLLIIGAVLLSAGAIGQYKTAGEYMDAISKEYRSIKEDMWDYTNAASHGKSAKTVEKKRAELVQTTYAAKGKVKRMPAYEGSTAYRDSVASFLNMYYLVLKEDYAKIVNMEEIAEQSYDAMEAYMLAKQEANKKLSSASDMLAAEQTKFAEEYGIELVDADDDLTKKMAKADEVYVYYNELYLIFFKSYIQDIYLSDAIGKKDVSAIEQNRSALSASAKEGLEKLKKIRPYDGDNSLVENLGNILRFYEDEADNKIEAITNYYLKAENFATIQKSFDQKKEKDRTQDDVDQFNKAVNESNAAGERFNTTINEVNKNRTANLGRWNTSVDKFTDRHVPKGKSK